jgi:hypothetical protein
MRSFQLLHLFICLLFNALCGISAVAQSQSRGHESEILHNLYEQRYRADSRLISGDFYLDLTPGSTTGHPYFGTRDWVTGSVNTVKGLFEKVELRYDICKNQLVCNTAGFTRSQMQISLDKANISSFTLGDQRFVPVPSPSGSDEIRFAQELTAGPLSLLWLQSKKLKIPAGGNSTYAYETVNRLLLRQGDSLMPYRGRKTLFSLYPALRNELRDYIRRENLPFIRQPRQAHASLVGYCNTLLNRGQ